MEKNIIILFYPFIDSKEDYYNIPWALLYLERMIRHLNLEVVIIDERFESNYSFLIQKNCDKVLFSGVSAMIGSQITGGIKFTNEIRKYTNSPVIWGGWFPTLFPELLLETGIADYICIGQGEIPFLKFTESIKNNNFSFDIPGIGYKHNGTITINKKNKLNNPIAFPQINLNLINLKRLTEGKSKAKKNFVRIDYLASIGCNQACKFCNLVYIYEKKWFAKKIEEIISDLIFLKSEVGANHIVFIDDNLFVNKLFIINLCNNLIASNLNLTWAAFAHIGYFLEHFSHDDIKLFYEAGCRELRTGAESGDQDVLEIVGKKISVEKNIQIIKTLKEFNIHIRFLTMVCFPWNPEKDFWKTIIMIGRAKQINKDIDSRICFFFPIPNTEIYPVCIEYGFRHIDSIEKLISFYSQDFTLGYKAPWNKKDFSRILLQFVNFYFVFTDPLLYRKFPKQIKPIAYIANKILYQFIRFRFKYEIVNFRFEPIVFGKLLKYINR
jgi:radical SAM superfamily enzyme YgiQ (UPF0313 family)